MSYPDYFIMMVMGGGFIGAGIGVFFRGKRAEKNYYNSLATRTDLREFLEHTPEHPGHTSIKLGGWITIIIGAVLLGIGGGLRFLG